MIPLLLYFIPAGILSLCLTQDKTERIILTIAFAPIINTVVLSSLLLMKSISLVSVLLSYLFIIGLLLTRKPKLKGSGPIFQEIITAIMLGLIFLTFLIFSCLYPYFKTSNIHFMDIIQAGEWIALKGTFPPIPINHVASAEVPLFYPPAISYFVAFHNLFSHYDFTSFIYSFFSSLYGWGYLLALVLLARELHWEETIGLMAGLLSATSIFFLSTVALEITHSTLVPFYSAFFLYLLLKWINTKNDRDFYLLCIIIGFSFWVRIYLGVFCFIFFLLCSLRSFKKTWTAPHVLFFLVLFLLGISWNIYQWISYQTPIYTICFTEKCDFLNVSDPFARYLSINRDKIGNLGESTLERLRFYFLYPSPPRTIKGFLALPVHNLIFACPFSAIATCLFLLGIILGRGLNPLLLGWTGFVFLLSVSIVPFVQRSARIFFPIYPSLTLFAGAAFHILLNRLHLRQSLKTGFLKMTLIFLLFVLFLSLMLTDVNFRQNRIEHFLHPFPSLQTAFYRQLGGIDTVVKYIGENIKDPGSILYVGRGETRISVVPFLLGLPIWECSLYDNPWTEGLHRSRSEKEVLSFLRKNNIKYILTVDKNCLKSTVFDLFETKEYPQLLLRMLMEGSPHFTAIIQTTDPEETGPNVVLYEIK